MCAKAEDGTHTLMKGDEIVYGPHLIAYELLFLSSRQRYRFTQKLLFGDAFDG